MIEAAAPLRKHHAPCAPCTTKLCVIRNIGFKKLYDKHYLELISSETKHISSKKGDTIKNSYYFLFEAEFRFNFRF